MKLTIETERERPRRWIAEVLELPGVLVYGRSEPDAIRRGIALAIEVIRAGYLRHVQRDPDAIHAWKSTAAIYADPRLRSQLSRPIS